MSDDKYKDIVEVFEFTRADAASIGLQDGTHRMLDVVPGTNDEGQPCALYIVGKINPKVLQNEWDENEPTTPLGG